MFGNAKDLTSLFDSLRRHFSAVGKAIGSMEDLAEQRLEQKVPAHLKSDSLLALSRKLDGENARGDRRQLSWSRPESVVEESANRIHTL
jgi:hypothetical protein